MYTFIVNWQLLLASTSFLILYALHPESQEQKELKFARQLLSCEDEGRATSPDLRPRQPQADRVERNSEGGLGKAQIAKDHG